jgi:hypothetical protein
MSIGYLVFLGFIYSDIFHTHNMDSIAWVIYSPGGQLVSLGGVFLGPSMNNVA